MQEEDIDLGQVESGHGLVCQTSNFTVLRRSTQLKGLRVTVSHAVSI